MKRTGIKPLPSVHSTKVV